MSIIKCSCITLVFMLLISTVNSPHAFAKNGNRFEISYASDANTGPVTGRVYAMISRTAQREPRLQIGTRGVPFYGKDIFALKPGEVTVIDDAVFGYPVKSLKDIPKGEYYIQGFVNIYTEFKRSDGHTVWMHDDQWEGQHFNRSPKNIFSEV